MRAGSRFRLFAATAAAMWLAACSVSPAPRLYVLSPLAEPVTAGAVVDGIALAIGPVTLAPHLDRPQIVSRRGSRIQIDDFDRWAEPLADGIARTLAENLGALLATDRLWLYPWPPSVPVDVQVTVAVSRFDDGGDGDGLLDVRWTLMGEGRMLATRRFERREPAASPEPAATVEALSRALAELSREIAGALAARADGRAVD